MNTSVPNSVNDTAAALGGMAVMVVAMFMVLAFYLVICGLVAYFCADALKRIPPQFRLIEPGMSWVMLVPCVNFFWGFFLYLKISDSFKGYFASTGDPTNGDCGYNLGLWAAICTIGGIIPLVGYFASLGNLVLTIMFLVKITELKNKIPLAPTF